MPFAALNQACFSDAAAIVIPDNYNLEQPIQVVFVSQTPTENDSKFLHITFMTLLYQMYAA